jgi:hypothetical protein
VILEYEVFSFIISLYLHEQTWGKHVQWRDVTSKLQYRWLMGGIVSNEER